MTDGTRVAWVTGAGKGIGRAVAARLAGEGWRVAVSARTASDLDTLRSECRDDAVHAFPMDVSDASAIEDTVAAIEDSLGAIDLAVLNAGTHEPDSALEFKASSVRRLMDVNFMGTVQCLEPLLARFTRRGGGHIAVVGSLAGYRGLPKAAGYGASKAALISLCESLKPELDSAGVRLTLINPGFVKTPLTDRNTFEMPFLMPVDDAAKAIVRGIEGTAFEVVMPRRFALIMRALRRLPDGLYFALTRRMIKR